MNAILAILALAGNTAPAPTGGYASHYAPAVFETVVAHRFAMDWWPNQPPADWYTVAGYAATTDCRAVGRIINMRPVGADRWQRVLVADCAGDAETLGWMLDNSIVAELDHTLFTRWAAEYGVPLAVEVEG